MMEHVCDNLCFIPKNIADQEELDCICAECKMGKFVCDILNCNSNMKDIEKARLILRNISDTEPMSIDVQKRRLLSIMSSLQEIKRLEAMEHEVDLQDMQKRNDCRSNGTVSGR